eukprot:scpid72624/ scgid6379/ 
MPCVSPGQGSMHACATDSWTELGLNLQRSFTIPHFKLHRKDRLQQRGGGVGIYCHESVLARRRTDLETDLELLWIEVSVSGGIVVLVGCCYRQNCRVGIEHLDGKDTVDNRSLNVEKQSVLQFCRTSLFYGEGSHLENWFHLSASRPEAQVSW